MKKSTFQLIVIFIIIIITFLSVSCKKEDPNVQWVYTALKPTSGQYEVKFKDETGTIKYMIAYSNADANYVLSAPMEFDYYISISRTGCPVADIKYHVTREGVVLFKNY